MRDALRGTSGLSVTGNWRTRTCALACIALFVASLVRYRLDYDPTDEVPHDPETFRLARTLAEKGQFANPFVPMDTGPSAIMGPAFPSLLAVFIRVFGDGATGIYAIKWAAATVLSLQLALFPVFSRMLGMGELNGVVGAVVWIVAKVGIAAPPHRPAVPMFGWESFYAAFLVAVAVCCCRRYLDSSMRDSNRLAWLIGVLLGLLALTSAAAGIVLVGWIVWVVHSARCGVLRKAYLPLVLVPVLMVAPWLLRNYVVLHRVVPVRDNFGLELSTANNDCAMFGINQNIRSGCFAKVHPNANVNEARKVVAYGEPRYCELKLREAGYWIRNHPARFFNLCTLRFAAFWLPPASGGPYALLGDGRRLERTAICGMTVLSIAGLFILYRKDNRSTAMCALCLGLYPLVYYIVQYEYRYRYPILWVTFLLGALPLTNLARATAESMQRLLHRVRRPPGFAADPKP